ncbi:MAG: hypothetical protein A3J24_04840 [Deltaproteobacteria bacterium RIFCSPLOWO2_02_FULL_53_8]|nr:MAG: hypothetical protein A3J24_04840 [Deltaproteobacteria bacterium RIFCSPLOWO2_02_FULL_53_8]
MDILIASVEIGLPSHVAFWCRSGDRKNLHSAYMVFVKQKATLKGGPLLFWWARTGLNRGPKAYEPVKNGQIILCSSV